MTSAFGRFDHIRAVLFDLDGTLVDSAPDLAGAVDGMRVKRGLPSLPLVDYRPMAGAGARGMLGIAFGVAPDHPDFNALREEFFVAYEGRLTRDTQVFRVVTNKAARFTLPLTRALPLFRTAGAIVSGDTTPHAKPHPAPLLEAARLLGLDPACCMYVGDDERDIVAGLAAGMATVAATYGYLGQQSDVSRWGAHAVIHSPAELQQLLQFST